MGDFQTFVDSSKAKNTVYSETTAYNAFKRFLLSTNEERESNEIPPEVLSNILCNFYINGTKLDGSLLVYVYYLYTFISCCFKLIRLPARLIIN